MKNEKNFRVCFENNYKKLLKYLTQSKTKLGINCEDDAKEVISEVFYTLAMKVVVDDTVDVATQFNYAYLQAMCQNKALQRISEKKKHPIESLYLYTSEGEERDVLRKDIVETLWRDDDAEELREAQIAFIEDLLIEKLSDKQLKLVFGKYYEKKSYHDLAIELGYGDETVAKATMWRIMDKIRKLVDYRPAS